MYLYRRTGVAAGLKTERITEVGWYSPPRSVRVVPATQSSLLIVFFF